MFSESFLLCENNEVGISYVGDWSGMEFHNTVVASPKKLLSQNNSKLNCSESPKVIKLYEIFDSLLTLWNFLLFILKIHMTWHDMGGF